MVRVALVVFIAAWIFGPYALRAAVPIWIVFAVALGLEVNFLVAALRESEPRVPDRRPQRVDRERYGYEGETEDLIVVRRGGEEVWIPYTGLTDEEIAELLARPDVPDELGTGHVPVYDVSRGPSAARRFVVGIGVIGALALTIWFVESHTGWNSLSGESRSAAEKRFSLEASRIAGKPVDIRCDESRDYVGAVQHADGVAYVGGDRAYLTPERCYDLYRLAFEDEVTFSQTARAIAVLAHEAWHLRGVGDEGTTECYALQSGVELGRRLGVSEDTARDMMRQQFVENALHGAGTIEYLLPKECRDGGQLDLDAASSRFP
jgi:hypothetical protein